MCVAKVHALFVVLGCLATLLVGTLLVAVGIKALDSRSFLEASHIILADTEGDGDGVHINLDLLINVIIIAGVTAIVASFAGLIGACRHSKSLLCLYSFSAILFGVVFLASGMSMLMIFETLAPKIREHVHQYCDAEVYPTLLSHLHTEFDDKNCGDALAPSVNVVSSPTTIISRRLTLARFLASTATPGSSVAPVEKPCGPTCEEQVKLVHTMGGCRTLRFLCTNHYHKTASLAHDDPSVVRQFEFYLRALIVSLISFGSFLLLSVICTCCFIYTLGTGRQGKKGAQSLLMRLFCPCLRRKTTSPYEHKRLRNEEYDVE